MQPLAIEDPESQFRTLQNSDIRNRWIPPLAPVLRSVMMGLARHRRFAVLAPFAAALVLLLAFASPKTAAARVLTQFGASTGPGAGQESSPGSACAGTARRAARPPAIARAAVSPQPSIEPHSPARSPRPKGLRQRGLLQQQRAGHLAAAAVRRPAAVTRAPLLGAGTCCRHRHSRKAAEKKDSCRY
jgi:hypothetical protein